VGAKAREAATLQLAGWLAGCWLTLVCSWQAASCVAAGCTFHTRLHRCIVISALPRCAPRLPALPACCRTDLASKEGALVTLTSEKEELEARHNELRWGVVRQGGLGSRRQAYCQSAWVVASEGG
jgi:hypothetical protein